MRLSGRDLQGVADRVIVVCSVDERGFPHPALLSYFEVVAANHNTIRLALYSDSRTMRNARREGRLTLIIVDAGVAYYVKGAVRELSRSMRATPHNAKLGFEVAEVLADEPSPEHEPGAAITGGITYIDPQRAEKLASARHVLAELLE